MVKQQTSEASLEVRIACATLSSCRQPSARSRHATAQSGAKFQVLIILSWGYVSRALLRSNSGNGCPVPNMANSPDP